MSISITIGTFLIFKNKISGLEKLKTQVDCPEYYNLERRLPKLAAGYYIWILRDNIIFRDGSDGQYIVCDFNYR